MSDCRKCAYFEVCAATEDCSSFIEKRITNGDRIRLMTDVELADFILAVGTNGGLPLVGNPIRYINWLKSPIKEVKEEIG
jgi:hypothetical protein